jgi:pimeloyl-ACP methyl ester carboxylesterase/uncharacterized protein (DUF2141 family)
MKKIIFVVSIALLITSCNFFGIKEQQEKAAEFCQLTGTIAAEQPKKSNLIVALLRHKSGSLKDKNNWALVDHYVLEKPGKWTFYSRPGTYFLTAFLDINNNKIFERDEPAIPFDTKRKFNCAPSEHKSGINLVIPHQGRIPGDAPVDISNLQARSIEEQLNVSLGQALAIGEVISLEDQRFSLENASKGLWKPFDFIWESKPGIYFLQPFDENKIPILFIHGINGTPVKFSFLIKNLDQSRFQPWVAYYPSGSKLNNIASHLNRTITQLKAQHHFQNLFIVAHSMGGLVARDMILENNKTFQEKLYSLFISISTPWNGHNAAKIAQHAPAAAYSWLDITPGSQFLSSLFYTENKSTHLQFPANISHHLIFTYLTGESDDGTISIESQLRPEAQKDAEHLYGFLQSHNGILGDAKVSALLNKIIITEN